MNGVSLAFVLQNSSISNSGVLIEGCRHPFVCLRECIDMSLKSVLLLLLSASTAAMSTAIMRFALRDSYQFKGSVLQFCQDSLRLLERPAFLIGMLMFIAANLLWLLVLGSQKLSVAYPVQIGLVVVFNALISSLCFSEKLAMQGYVGLVLIVVGVALIVR